MKRLALLSIFVLLASGLAVLTHMRASNGPELPMVAETNNGNDDDDGTCDTGTLKGAYGVAITGTRPAPPPLSGTPSYVPGTIEQIIGVSLQTFDGEGNFTLLSNNKGSLSGLFPNILGTGTYIVNPDCSGTTTLSLAGPPFTVVSTFVIVQNGKEYRGIAASPALVMVSFSGRRVD